MKNQSFTVIDPARLELACRRFLEEEERQVELELDKLLQSMIGNKIGVLRRTTITSKEQARQLLLADPESEAHAIRLASGLRSERPFKLLSLARAANGNMIMLTADDAHLLVDFLMET